jgi:hypothetical protein
MDNFVFNPTDGFLNTNSYPDPASGTAARTQLQSLHTQTQIFLNEQVVATINSLIQQINALQTQVDGFANLFTTSGLRIVAGGVTYAITVSNGTVTATEVS